MKTKRIISFIAALLLCAAMGTGAYALVSPSDEFYVTDSANVLSNETEQMIINYNGALEQQCSGAQIVVVTVDYLGGMYCDEYAYQLFNDWGVGSSEYNNGMLLLLAVQENKAWLAYGLGLNSLISSSDVDDMLDKYFWDGFDSGDYDEAVTALFKALLSWYDEHYDSSTASMVPNRKPKKRFAAERSGRWNSASKIHVTSDSPMNAAKNSPAKLTALASAVAHGAAICSATEVMVSSPASVIGAISFVNDGMSMWYRSRIAVYASGSSFATLDRSYDGVPPAICSSMFTASDFKVSAMPDAILPMR